MHTNKRITECSNNKVQFNKNIKTEIKEKAAAYKNKKQDLEKFRKEKSDLSKAIICQKI